MTRNISQRLCIGVAAWLLAASVSAWAQPRPLVQPTRDVAISYQVSGVAVPGLPPGPHRMDVAYSAAEQRVRLASPDYPQGFAIVALAARSVLVVLPAARSYIRMPMRGPEMALLTDDPGLRFTRAGTASVAGLRCTLWRVADTRAAGRQGSACLTADGVLLRGDDGPGGRSVVAIGVRYGHQPGARFMPPPGFNRMEIPRLPQR